MLDIKQIVEKVKDFPTLPTIYSALLEVIANPRSTAQDVADVISKDQASSTKILRTVNSSIYGIRNEIDTISQAVFHLGFNEVKNLVISLSMVDMMSNTKSLVDFNVVDFWKHSIAVGVITRFIGKLKGIRNIENYFLSGIIHDFGKLFFLKNFYKEYEQVIKIVSNEDKTIKDAEKEIFGTNHTEIGAMLAKKWALPGSIANSIQYHEEGTIDGKDDVLVASVHLANIVARAMSLGNPGDHLIPRPNKKVVEYLNIEEDSFSTNYQRIMMDYEQSVGILILK